MKEDDDDEKEVEEKGKKSQNGGHKDDEMKLTPCRGRGIIQVHTVQETFEGQQKEDNEISMFNQGATPTPAPAHSFLLREIERRKFEAKKTLPRFYNNLGYTLSRSYQARLIYSFTTVIKAAAYYFGYEVNVLDNLNFISIGSYETFVVS
jgi:hypothetical protein